MPSQNNKVLSQPIDVIFRFLQSISFVSVRVVVLRHLHLLVSFIALQDARSNLAVRPVEYAYRGTNHRIVALRRGES